MGRLGSRVPAVQSGGGSATEPGGDGATHAAGDRVDQHLPHLAHHGSDDIGAVGRG